MPLIARNNCPAALTKGLALSKIIGAATASGTARCERPSGEIMTINYFWQLDRHPVGPAFLDALRLRTETLAPLRPGEVRIRAAWLSMDSGTRMWMSPRTDGYQRPLPLGSQMVGLAVGRVVPSRDPRLDRESVGGGKRG